MQHVKKRRGRSDAANEMNNDRQAQKIDNNLRPDIYGRRVISGLGPKIQGVDIQNIREAQQRGHSNRPTLLVGDTHFCKGIGSDQGKDLEKKENANDSPAENNKPVCVADQHLITEL